MSYSIQIVSDTVTPKLLAAVRLMAKGIQDGLEEAGAEMEATAKQIVPVRTGFLRSTIYHLVDSGALTLELGATADYALYVEMGTRRAHAQPFIRPSFEANQQRLLDAIVKGVLDAF
jgi:HK97 gp10 family phage protein